MLHLHHLLFFLQPVNLRWRYRPFRAAVPHSGRLFQPPFLACSALWCAMLRMAIPAPTSNSSMSRFRTFKLLSTQFPTRNYQDSPPFECEWPSKLAGCRATSLPSPTRSVSGSLTLMLLACLHFLPHHSLNPDLTVCSTYHPLLE